MSHTKGPWRIRVNKNDDQDTCDMSICGDIFVLADINGPQYEHQKANARLISAAPDLLEAAQLFVAYDTGCDDDENDVAIMLAYADAKKAIVAAIAKATQS